MTDVFADRLASHGRLDRRPAQVLADAAARHAHWLLRGGLAAVFLYHGIGKFPTLGGFAAMMGLPLPVAFLVAAGEVGIGLLILAAGALPGRWGDLGTRVAGAGVVPIMVGAIALVHWPRWSFTPAEGFPMGGMEFQVVLLLTGLWFALRGNRG